MTVTAETSMPLIDRLRAARLPNPEERRRIRDEAGASLVEVGDELRVSALTVSRWERGLVEPSRDHAIAYRRLLEQLRELARE